MGVLVSPLIQTLPIGFQRTSFMFDLCSNAQQLQENLPEHFRNGLTPKQLVRCLGRKKIMVPLPWQAHTAALPSAKASLRVGALPVSPSTEEARTARKQNTSQLPQGTERHHSSLSHTRNEDAEACQARIQANNHIAHAVDLIWFCKPHFSSLPMTEKGF